MVRFENVGLRYGAGPEVLSDISFDIAPRSFQFLTGPSGAGKTSLLRLLSLARKPTRGLASMFGFDAATLDRAGAADLRRRIGLVPQEVRLLDHLTVADNVGLPLRIAGRAASQYRAEVAELLDWVGLGRKLDCLPPQLSGGERQRVAMARALIARPDVLLADEPTGNVDLEMARRILRLFVEMRRAGTAVVLATHDLSLMDLFDAPRLVLHGGRLHVDA
jgi:cell division transport system ATP-binding protein